MEVGSIDLKRGSQLEPLRFSLGPHVDGLVPSLGLCNSGVSRFGNDKSIAVAKALEQIQGLILSQTRLRST